MKRFVVKKNTRIFFVLALLFCTSQSWSQTETSAQTDKPSYFKVTGNYLTNSVYYGRKDSLPMPYFTASLGYYDKSGFFVAGSVSYLFSKGANRIDYSALDLGYNFTVSDKFSGSVYGNKSWYNQSSTTITSDIKGSIGTLLSYDLNALQINGGVDLTFANKTDIGINLGISHDFVFGKEGDQFSF